MSQLDEMIKQKIDKNSPFYRRLPKFIQTLIDLDFPLEMDVKNGTYIINHFYKSKTLIIVEDLNTPDLMVAFDKNGPKGVVSDPEQIILWNYEWFISSKLKNNTYPELDSFWANKFKERKLLKVVRYYVPDLEHFEELKQNVVKGEVLDEDKLSNMAKQIDARNFEQDEEEKSVELIAEEDEFDLTK